MSKQRTITLTGQAPVRIVEDEWPVIASADGDSYAGNDYGGVYQQVLSHGEVDVYRLRVRQHADGRALVYGTLTGSPQWGGEESRRGGELLAAGADLPAAIARVAEDVHIPESVARECVADLPAVSLE